MFATFAGKETCVWDPWQSPTELRGSVEPILNTTVK
jgi:hypothetical protein